MNTGDGRLQPISPTQLGEISLEYVRPAILTAAWTSLELNHVEAGLLEYLCDPRQRVAVTQGRDCRVLDLWRDVSLHAVHRS